jgi:hypothetical protein
LGVGKLGTPSDIPSTDRQETEMPLALVAPPIAALGMGIIGTVIVILIVLFIVSRVL